MLVTMATGPIAPTPIPPPRRTWTDAEWGTLRRGEPAGGWVPAVLGDRVELTSTATGKTIYAMRFRRELTGWKIMSAEVESDPQTHQPDRPEKESDQLQFILERLVT